MKAMILNVPNNDPFVAFPDKWIGKRILVIQLEEE